MKNILLVDDSTSIRNIIKAALVTQYNVTEAIDGIEGLKAAKSKPIDFFLLDVNMPNMDGISLLEELRKLPEYLKTPVLMLTTETKDELKQKAKTLGASGWVIKPCAPEKLLGVIQKIIE